LQKKQDGSYRYCRRKLKGQGEITISQTLGFSQHQISNLCNQEKEIQGKDMEHGNKQKEASCLLLVVVSLPGKTSSRKDSGAKCKFVKHLSFLVCD
jgi:hypothetical protein